MFGVGLWAAVALMSAIAVGSMLFAPGAHGRIWQMLPIPLLAAGLGWVLLVSPKLTLADDGVVVDNPLRRIEVPAERITGVRTGRGFALETDEGPIQAWAAPAPDRLQGQRRLGLDGAGADRVRDPRVLADEDGGVRTSALPGTLSGDAAMSARHHGLVGAEAPAEGARPIRRRLQRGNLAVVAVTLAATAAALLLG